MNKLSLGMISGVFAAVMLITPAFAWSFMVSGNGQCQQDGSFKITWTIDNHLENQPLKITKTEASSAEKITPTLPGAIGAKQTQSYTQIVDGTKAATYTLKITGHWNGDTADHYSTGTVHLYKPCTQPPVTPPVTPPVVPPVTPPAGGMGGGTTETPTPAVETPVVTTPQVVTPVGAVSAGNGGAPKVISLASIAGLIGSVSALGFGIRGLKKQA
jgi:hypothetical protein